MNNAATKPSKLEDQLDMMRGVSSVESANRVRQGIDRRIKIRRRIVLLALCGALVSLLATVIFVSKGDPFGYFALAFTTLIMGLAAWKSARQAEHMSVALSGEQLLTTWQRELRQQLRQTLLAQLVAAQFSALVAWVLWRHGLSDFRSWVYLSMALAIWVFALYQLLITRPALKRELVAIDDSE